VPLPKLISGSTIHGPVHKPVDVPGKKPSLPFAKLTFNARNGM
jgi:hypothetical protein